MKKIFYNLSDRACAIWYILTKRNFIIAGYNYITTVDKEFTKPFYIEHLSDDKKYTDIFRDAICEMTNPKNNHF